MTREHVDIESSAVEIAAAIRAHGVSSREIVAMCLARIGSLNARLNAVVQQSPTALDEADEADRALARGASIGPLHGVPFTVKDDMRSAYPYGITLQSRDRRRGILSLRAHRQ